MGWRKVFFIWLTVVPSWIVGGRISLALEIAQQPNPNEDRFISPSIKPSFPEPNQPILPKPAPDTAPTPEISPSFKILVRQIEIVGNTAISEEQLTPIVQPLEGSAVTVVQLQKATDQITLVYQKAGYLTSRAVLPEQEINNGVVRIRIIEGTIEKIEIEGTKRLYPNYIRQRLQQKRSPLNVNQLENQLRLLRNSPLFKTLEASLRAGSAVGQSVLIVKVTEAAPFYGGLNFDNYSPPSIGAVRTGITLGSINLSGYGDSFAASYNRSTSGGLDLLDLGYVVPFNANNGTLGLRTVFSSTKVTESEFAELNIEGESEFYELSIRQPLIRKPTAEFALSIGYDYRDGQTFIFDRIATPFGSGADEEGITRTSVLRLGQDYFQQDQNGTWAMRSQFNIGTGLFAATVNDAPVPDSRFFSWQGQVQRFQKLSDNQLLIVDASLQLTPDSLLASEQFVIGGGQSIRGYRQNARSGDNGVRFLIEDRITIAQNQPGIALLQLAPFADIGAVWNHPDNPNELPDQTFLASVGLGLLWQPLPKFNIRLDYGLPLVDLSDRGDNLQDDGFYFSVNYQN